jgi:hypothetical protein
MAIAAMIAQNCSRSQKRIESMMRTKRSLALCSFAACFLVTNLFGDETWYETQGGTTYRVTRRVEKRPVAETRTETRTETVYTTEYETELREASKMVWVPVTQYVTEPRWHHLWNPFVEPYVTYETRPVTRWELRTQTVREPITRRKDVPQAKIVQVPVRALGFVDQPYEERIVVTTPNGPADERYANREAASVRSAELPRLGQPATTLGAPIRR